MDNSSNNIDLTTPVQYLKGVGPARAKAFESLGVNVAGDLLEYYPRSWIFMPEAVKIKKIQPDTEVTIVGIVESTDYLTFRKPPIFEATIADETGYCRVIWFNGGYLRNQLAPGMIITASGKAVVYKIGRASCRERV